MREGRKKDAEPTPMRRAARPLRASAIVYRIEVQCVKLGVGSLVLVLSSRPMRNSLQLRLYIPLCDNGNARSTRTHSAVEIQFYRLITLCGALKVAFPLCGFLLHRILEESIGFMPGCNRTAGERR